MIVVDVGGSKFEKNEKMIKKRRGEERITTCSREVRGEGVRGRGWSEGME
jgi:hypothetical protein